MQKHWTATIIPLLLAACVTSQTQPNDTAASAQVVMHGDFDSSHLLRRPSGGKASKCTLSYGRMPEPVPYVDLPNRYIGKNPTAISTALDRSGVHFMRVGASAFNDAASKARLRTDILGWADADALRWKHAESGVIYFTLTTIFPIIVVYSHHKDQFAPEERAKVEAWMIGIVDRVGRTAEVRTMWTLDNKKYLYGATQMALGIATDQRQRFDRGVAIYKTAIAGMRSDGSLPGDSGRGGSAIHYTNHALASLTAMAEMAANQGVDLYGYRRNGRGLDTAIDFLIAATRDPELITPYAREMTGGGFEGYTPTNQLIEWDRKWGGDWGFYYITRFPDSPTAKRLIQASPLLRAGKSEPLAIAGGDVGCFVFH